MKCYGLDPTCPPKATHIRKATGSFSPLAPPFSLWLLAALAEPFSPARPLCPAVSALSQWTTGRSCGQAYSLSLSFRSWWWVFCPSSKKVVLLLWMFLHKCVPEGHTHWLHVWILRNGSVRFSNTVAPPDTRYSHAETSGRRATIPASVLRCWPSG